MTSQKVALLERQVDAYRTNDENLQQQLRKTAISSERELKTLKMEREKLKNEFEVVRMKSSQKDSELSGIRAEMDTLQNQLEAANGELQEVKFKCAAAEKTSASGPFFSIFFFKFNI